MTRNTTTLFQINGKPMLTPDAEPNFSYEDIDSADTGRLQNGYMYRSVVRYKVGTWKFSYAQLSEEDKQYMESLFPDAPYIQFTHPDRKTGNPVTTKCYRSKYSLTWYSAKEGVWKGYGFSIIEC